MKASEVRAKHGYRPLKVSERKAGLTGCSTCRHRWVDGTRKTCVELDGLRVADGHTCDKRESLEEQRVRRTEALCLGEKVEPDVSVPDQDSPFGTTAYGFEVNFHYGEPHKAWTQQTRHGRGKDTSWASQGGRPLYSTPELALLAYRYEKAARFADELAAIDARIAQERAKTALAGSGESS